MKVTNLFVRLAIGMVLAGIAITVGIIMIPHAKVSDPAPWVAIAAISLMVLVIAYASLLLPWGDDKPKKPKKKSKK